MTDYQELLVKLIDEVISTCSELEIPVVVADRLAWDAYKFHRFHDSTFDAYFIVDANDRDRLAASLGSKEFREVELTTEFDVPVIRYVNSNSLYFDLCSPAVEKHGVAATIKLVDFSEGGAVNCTLPKWEKDGSFTAMPVKLSKETLFPAGEGEFEGMRLPIANDIDGYFASTLGSEWSKSSYSGYIRRNHFETVCDVSIPYRAYTTLLGADQALDCDDFMVRADYYDIKRRYDEIGVCGTKHTNAKILVSVRYHVWEQMYPIRKEINSAARFNNAKRLEQLIGPAVTEIENAYDAKKISVCPGAGYLKAIMSVLTSRHGEKYAKGYEKGILPQHLVDVEESLMRKGQGHVLLDSDGKPKRGLFSRLMSR